MKKGSFFRNVLDTIRSNQTNQAGGVGGSSSCSASARAGDFAGQLKPSHFALAQVARHGFPENPTALAFDPVQKICVIGTKSGALRVFGRPGVDIWAQHKPEFAVTHIKFIVNQGAIITVTSDDSIHLWSMRGPNLKLQLSSSSSSSSTSSSPAQAQQATSLGGSQATTLPQTSTTTSTAGGSSLGQQQTNQQAQLATSATTTAPSTITKHPLLDQDSGAQPGDIDYLCPKDNFQAGTSPTNDKDKSYASKQLKVLHTLKFQKERITCLHQTLMSKWLYIGTEKGNLHVANVVTFELSGYSIAWNKAIELSRKTHPGSIIHISECPQDSNKILIGYESGCIVLWDLKNRNADGRYYHTENLLWLSWHYEGKQFVAAHGDGSLVTWQTRSNARPAQILNPHAKTASSSATPQTNHSIYDQQQQQTAGDQVTSNNQQHHSLASNFARALNNELYRPINKVEWKTSKSNEQFLLFSGGLPYDGLEQSGNIQETSITRQSAIPSPSCQAQSNQIQPQQQYSKTSSLSPGGANLVSGSFPTSPSISPSNFNDPSGNKIAQNKQLQQRKYFRSTSLTVMYGKSITVLEMDDTIIDFITVCDSSPYENDASDPFAVIVLLANDFILLDLTSAGYPSFDSPYPSSTLNESPVTCVQYLADCRSDLIPFLYSTSQNVVSRAPKKGFSDKEWPINGGEWGQPMQSYPELVLTGHADGTIKFWDMSSVNFDLISKIKTSKLFERPIKLPNSLIISAPSPQHQLKDKQRTLKQQQQQQVAGTTSDSSDTFSSSSSITLQDCLLMSDQKPIENIFAIEKIEYYPSSKHLVVAGALSQVIQFKLNKKDAGQAAISSELATILIEPQISSTTNPQQQPAGANEKLRVKQRQHMMLKSKSHLTAPATISGSSGPQAAASSQRNRMNGFQPEVICLSSLLVTPLQEQELSTTSSTNSVTPTSVLFAAAAASFSYCCQAAPKITALSLQSTHNILAYSHETGIVIVDIIQKCVILSATLADLYGGSSIMTNTNRDISIQPFATSSILQHHYQSGSNSEFARRNQIQGEGNGNNNFDNLTGNTTEAGISAPIVGETTKSNSNNSSADNGSGIGNSAKLRSAEGDLHNDNGATSLHKSSTSTNEATLNQSVGQIALSAESKTCKLVSLESDIVAVDEEESSGGKEAEARSRKEKLDEQDNDEGGANNGERESKLRRQVSVGHSKDSQTVVEAALKSSHQQHETGFEGSADSDQLEKQLHCDHDEDEQQQLESKLEFELVPESKPKLKSMSEFDPELKPMADNCYGSNGGRCSNDEFGKVIFVQAAPPRTRLAEAKSAKTSIGERVEEAVTKPVAPPRARKRQSVPIVNTANMRFSSPVPGANQLEAGAVAQDFKIDGPQLQPQSKAQTGRTLSLDHEIDCGSSSSLQRSQQLHQQPPEASNEDDSACEASEQRTVVACGNEKEISAADISNKEIKQQQQQQSSGNSSTILSSLFTKLRDKVDSSFTRSRSSSSSSTTATGTTPVPPNLADHASGESILCLCFLDWSQASSQVLQTNNDNNNNLQMVSTSSTGSNSNQTTGAASSTVASGPGSKSLAGSIANQVALYLGTSQGHVLLVSLSMPDSEDNRVLQLQSVIAEPTPQASIKLPGSILTIASFSFDNTKQKGASAAASGGLHSSPPPSLDNEPNSSTQNSSSSSALRNQSSSSFDSRLYNFVAVVSEKQARVFQIPNLTSQQSKTHHHHKNNSGENQSENRSANPQLVKLLTNNANLFAKIDLSDTSFACRSALIQIRQPDESCLVSYMATGNILVHSMPNLKPLMDEDFVPCSSGRIASSMCFSRNGHCLYQPSDSEISKFTISAQYKALINDMTGLLYVPKDMPEIPRGNFFKSLFSVTSSAASKQSDRDELFSECSAGKAQRGVAKHISSATGGPSGVEKLKGAAVGTMGHDVRVAREGLDERGEKLGEIEDKTLLMMNQSESYAQAAHQLAQKFKDKKWYQF